MGIFVRKKNRHQLHPMWLCDCILCDMWMSNIPSKARNIDGAADHEALFGDCQFDLFRLNESYMYLCYVMSLCAVCPIGQSAEICKTSVGFSPNSRNKSAQLSHMFRYISYDTINNMLTEQYIYDICVRIAQSESDLVLCSLTYAHMSRMCVINHNLAFTVHLRMIY